MPYDTYDRRRTERPSLVGTRSARFATAISLAIALAITLLAVFGDKA